MLTVIFNSNPLAIEGIHPNLDVTTRYHGYLCFQAALKV